MANPNPSAFTAVLIALLAGGAFIGRPQERLCGKDPSTGIYLDSQGVTGEGLPSDYDSTVLALAKSLEGDILTIYSVGPGQRASTHFFSSRDRGDSWTSESRPLESTLVVLGFSSLQAPSDGRFVYRYDPKLGIYFRSEDSGKTWRRPRYTLDEQSRSEFSSWFASDHEADFTIVAIHPLDPINLYATIRLLPRKHPSDDDRMHAPDRLFHSRDGGESWSPLAEGLMNRVPIGIGGPGGDVMYGVSTKGTVVRSYDGGRSWASASEQPLWRLLSRVSVRALAQETSRHLASPPMIRQILVDPRDNDTVFIVVRQGLLKTVDGGHSWRLLDLGFSETLSVNSLVVSKGPTSMVYVGTRHGVISSRDGGCSFTRIFPPTSSTVGKVHP